MTDGKPQLRLYNTLTRTKEAFAPIDADNVRMYVCGPTVYDYAHIGNARPAIVFDVLFRLLRHLYGDDHVTYVRNITDVDDKINARALRDFPDLPLNEAIRKVTEPTYEQYQKDVTALGCLAPTHQPRATEFVLPRADGKDDMVGMIQSLIDRGHAYAAKGESGREVLFDTRSMADYGQLSKRNLDEQQAGARVAVEAHKKNPSDFVLWKESSDDEPGWEATFCVDGKDIAIRGRPGWHIECSAMSAAYLGDVFDIHGGGLDLIFPHHENEIAQSRCAHGSEVMANVWMHNGFLQVEGRKMSKSDGNFVTINELLRSNIGDAVRWTMLKTHYRQPLDFTNLALLQAGGELKKLYEKTLPLRRDRNDQLIKIDDMFAAALCDDLDTPQAVARLHQLANSDDANDRLALRHSLEFLGMKYVDTPAILNKAVAFWGDVPNVVASAAVHWRTATANDLNSEVEKLETEALRHGWRFSIDRGRVQFLRVGESKSSLEEHIREAIANRLTFIADKNWAEADKIRDELLEQGIQLKDGKDPETGERITTWEVKR